MAKTKQRNHRLRRLRKILLTSIGLVIAALLWPIHPFFARIQPTVFGVPFSLVWMVICLFAMFLTLLGLYLVDERLETNEPPGRETP